MSVSLEPAVTKLARGMFIDVRGLSRLFKPCIQGRGEYTELLTGFVSTINVRLGTDLR